MRFNIVILLMVTLMPCALYPGEAAPSGKTAPEKKAAPDKKDSPPSETLKEALFIEAESNGLPGFDKKEQVKQNIWIMGDKLRMEDPERGIVLIIRLDKKEVWQINGRHSVYTVLKFSEFTKWRKQSVTNRKAVLKKVRAAPARMRKSAVKKYGFEEDFFGNVYDSKKPEMVETGEKDKKNGFNCRRITFKEHGFPVLDVWVTDEVKRPENIFKFYADLDMFDPALVEMMKKVKDFPVVLETRLDYGIFKCSSTTTVLKVKNVVPQKGIFDIPKGFTELKQKQLPKEVPCASCRKKTVNIKNARKTDMFFQWNLYTFYFCSKECRKKFIDEIKKATIEKPAEDEEEEEEEEQPAVKTPSHDAATGKSLPVKKK